MEAMILGVVFLGLLYSYVTRNPKGIPLVIPPTSILLLHDVAGVSC